MLIDLGFYHIIINEAPGDENEAPWGPILTISWIWLDVCNLIPYFSEFYKFLNKNISSVICIVVVFGEELLFNKPSDIWPSVFLVPPNNIRYQTVKNSILFFKPI